MTRCPRCHAAEIATLQVSCKAVRRRDLPTDLQDALMRAPARQIVSTAVLVLALDSLRPLFQ